MHVNDSNVVRFLDLCPKAVAAEWSPKSEIYMTQFFSKVTCRSTIFRISIVVVVMIMQVKTNHLYQLGLTEITMNEDATYSYAYMYTEI